jgi:8-oxo-dGTP diphosphatase
MKDKYIVNVEAAAVRGEHYLMIVRSRNEQQDPGALSMPGGKVESDGNLQDVLEETLLREVLEETGLATEGQPVYIESKAFLAAGGEGVVDVVFLVFCSEGDPYIQDTQEVESIHWMTADEILADERSPQWTCQSIKKAEAVRLSMGDQRAI